jgi:hypothetical protein
METPDMRVLIVAEHASAKFGGEAVSANALFPVISLSANALFPVISLTQY